MRKWPLGLFGVAIVAAMVFATMRPPQQRKPWIPSTYADQVTFLASDLDWKTGVYRFDRKFNLLGVTDVSVYGPDDPVPWLPYGPHGYTVPSDPLNNQIAIGLTHGGKIRSLTDLSTNPVAAATDRLGYTYVVSRIPLLTPAPLYKVSPMGKIVWSSPVPQNELCAPPQFIALDSQGDVFFGSTQLCGFPQFGRLVKVSSTGQHLWTVDLPLTGNPPSNTNVLAIAVDSQDNVWATLQPPLHIVHVDGQTGTILRNLKVSPAVGLSASLVMDSAGYLYAADVTATLVYRIDPESGTVLVNYSLPGGLGTTRPGLALDPTGREMWMVTILNVSPPFEYALAKLSLDTGQTSLISLQGLVTSALMPVLDGCGFVWAYTVDPSGDADGDGFPNRREIDAQSNPYDPNSQPGSTNISLSFGSGNSPRIRLVDPDGVLGSGGIDVSSLSMFVNGQDTNVLPSILSTARSVAFSPDGTRVDVSFEGISLPSGLKVEVSVRDKAGNRDWDLEVVP